MFNSKLNTSLPNIFTEVLSPREPKSQKPKAKMIKIEPFSFNVTIGMPNDALAGCTMVVSLEHSREVCQALPPPLPYLHISSPPCCVSLDCRAHECTWLGPPPPSLTKLDMKITSDLFKHEIHEIQPWFLTILNSKYFSGRKRETGGRERAEIY